MPRDAAALYTPRLGSRSERSELGDGLLRGKKAEALLARDALLGELIVGAEASWMRRLRGGTVGGSFLSWRGEKGGGA